MLWNRISYPDSRTLTGGSVEALRHEDISPIHAMHRASRYADATQDSGVDEQKN